MKTRMSIFAASLTAFLLASCAQQMEPAGEVSTVETTVTELTARINPASQGTKTSYDSVEGKFVWSDGDQIALHLSDGGYLSLPVAASTGKVSVALHSGVTRDYYAVYPASVADADNYGNTALKLTLPASYDISDIISGSRTADYSPCPLVAVNSPSSDNLDFNHVGGLLRITILKENVHASTQKIRLTFDKDVTGSYTVSNPGSTAPAITTAGTSSNNVVTFTLTNSASGVGALSSDLVLNLPVPCGSYDGFKAELLDNRNSVLSKESYTRPLTIARYHGKKLFLKPAAPSDFDNPLTIEPKGAGPTIVTINNIKTDNGANWKYSLDGGATKTSLTISSGTATISIPDGGILTLYQEGARQLLTAEYEDYPPFAHSGIRFSKPAYVYGNIMSLASENGYDSQMTLVPKQFANLFSNNNNLLSHPDKSLILPASELANSCYRHMFYGCTSLETAPKLLAESLADYCCSRMFYGCTSLKTAPELLAESLADFCYDYMFYGCTSLKTAPELPAKSLAESCYWQMFSGCTSLETAPELPAKSLAYGCYSWMFYECTSLETAPELPAESLADFCYDYMFYGCTSLKTAPELPATTLTESCYEGMFGGCKKLTTAPVLRAKTLVLNCYAFMFEECIALNYLECHATNPSASSVNVNNWLLIETVDIDPETIEPKTFKKVASVEWPRGASCIPDYWNVVDIQ